MRILVTIPHFFRRAATAAYGSERGDAGKRGTALLASLLALHQTFGHEQTHMEDMRVRCNTRVSASVDVVVCTTGDAHLVGDVQASLFRHHQTRADPQLLGYECHAVLAEALGRYDYYCFMEDDLVLSDPLFFWKIGWFSEVAGAHAVLQPHRYELSEDPPVRKLYIDSRLADPTISPRFQDRNMRPNLRGQVLGREIGFERVDNPHSGCFFLNAAQMERWTGQSFFLDRADGFAGPLESAATLGLMRTFDVYKPVRANAGFLEIHHLDRRYLGSRVRFAADFRLPKIEKANLVSERRVSEPDVTSQPTKSGLACI